MELYSTTLNLWFGDFMDNPWWDDEAWEDSMEEIKWPANEAQHLIISCARRAGKTELAKRIVFDSEKNAWVVTKKNVAEF